MKKIILLITVITVLAANCYCQVDSSAGRISDEYTGNSYTVKARNQKTVAWVLVGTGTALAGTGLLIGTSNFNTIVGLVENVNHGAVVADIGFLLIAGSIPFFIFSAVNKHKAKLSISDQKTVFQLPGKINKSIPGISLSIPIGK